MPGRIKAREEKGTAETEMVEWHHQLEGHEFEQTQGDSEGQGGLACCSPWGCGESDMTAVNSSNGRLGERSFGPSSPPTSEERRLVKFLELLSLGFLFIQF